MWFCNKCNKHRFEDGVCPCKEFVVIDEDGDEYKIQALTEEGAALKYAEKSNVECDYYLINYSAVITINNKKFRISAEQDIHYSADEI